MSESPVAADRDMIIAERNQADGGARWTATCKRGALRRISVRCSYDEEPTPLPHVALRLLAVKVHRIGDAEMIRLLLEHLHRRHPGIRHSFVRWGFRSISASFPLTTMPR